MPAPMMAIPGRDILPPYGPSEAALRPFSPNILRSCGSPCRHLTDGKQSGSMRGPQAWLRGDAAVISRAGRELGVAASKERAGSARATLKDIARLAGVGTATVDRVLNE